ncbi:MAG TPA: 50S ribosomal protein L18Ae [Methanocella sp.]|uniref:50S ribosomal protein L18Ae n=1 Tax=Methanocella sp. TaxID=2052833 RepID=UPI002CDB473D|nr:50S ribosomal protein L18Ae [Methanocella sp.]HTY90875.1 50S ribosomal protein L18Ae [Methanocella sp.]
MANYIVEGTFKAGVQWEKFSKEVESVNENTAREKVLSTLGSRHGINRNLIKIESVKKA